MSVWRDIRHGGRLLARAPGFTALAVTVLALGIGAAVTMFTVIDAVLFRPLPFPASERLVQLWEAAPDEPRNHVSPLNFVDWSEQAHAFAAMAAVAGANPTLTGGGGGAERIAGQAVTTAFFDVLRVRPIAGRTFVSDDTRIRNVTVISERFWRSRFGADPRLVGRSITLDGEPVVVVGIVPAEFQLLFESDLWVPFVPRRAPEERTMHYLQVIGRLKSGATIDDARADMAVVAGNIARISPATNKGWGITIDPLREALVGPELKTTTLVLGGIVTFVLLMACANVANLLLVRGVGRTREIAVRSALGGSRSRIARQLLTEHLLLASLGGAAGMLLGWAGVVVAPWVMPPGTLPESVRLAFDSRVLLASVVLILGTSVLFGLAPAMLAASIPLTAAITSSSRTATHAAGGAKRVLTIAEVAGAVLLVTASLLLLRTLYSLTHVDAGYRAPRVLTANLVLPFNRYDQQTALQFYDRAEVELSAIPGVSVAAIGTTLPLNGFTIGQGFEIVGDPAPDPANQPTAHYQMVTPGYFRALGIPLVRGRGFTARDRAESPQICIVNEELVRRYFRDRDPLGVTLVVYGMGPHGPTPVQRQIVGVVRQVKLEAGETENALEIYVPVAQNAWYWSTLAVQTAGEPLLYVNAVTRAIARIDKDLPLARIRTMGEVEREATARPRFRAELVTVFAAVAVVLAAVGIGGVLSFTVHQRTRELGVRVALGARTADILRVVLADGARMTAAGIAIGVVGAAALSRLLEALLFGVTPLDTATFMTAPLILAMTALAASVVPALRASRVDAAVALRQE
jgi:putative ABC transport system permease protein